MVRDWLVTFDGLQLNAQRAFCRLGAVVSDRFQHSDDPETWGIKNKPMTGASRWTLQKAGLEMLATNGEASRVICHLYDSP